MILARRRVPAAVAALWLLAAAALSSAPPLTRAGHSPAHWDTVLLLHGLGRSSWSMVVMEWKLESAGYRVVNIDYPSTEADIETLSRRIALELGTCCSAGEGRVHFVTHSMGGILVRHFLAHDDLPRLGRVVMLSPPNHGSEIIDWLRGYSFFGLVMPPAALQLGTDAGSMPNRLGPVDFELGVITGGQSSDPLGGRVIEGAHDGKVSVESARVEGMTDFLVVPESHTFIMNDGEVIAPTMHFLRTGSFDHSRAPAP